MLNSGPDYPDDTGGNVARFDIGKVLSRSFEVMGSNLGVFLILSLVLAGIPTFMWSLWTAPLVTDSEPEALLAMFTSSDFWLRVAAAVAIGLVTQAVLQIAITRATANSLSGRASDFGALLEAGFTLILPVVAISLVVALGVGIGLVLLIVPGILLWLYWSVAVPAFVQERIGPIAALRRSVDLTEGERGNIFVLMLVVGIGNWVFGAVVGWIGTMLGGTSPILPALAESLSAAVANMVSLTVVATAYVTLVEVKEGTAGSELETIFD